VTLSNPDLYPVEWPQLAAEIKQANHFVCQMCGEECRRQSGDRSLPVLTIAHIDQDYEAEAVFVAALCVRCHLVHDAPLGWVARRRHERWRQQRAGQLYMEWAA
jgi:hypothetical protein